MSESDFRLQRLRRLNSLLVTIAFIFAVCWMPLNVLNLVLDLYNPFQEDQETMLIIYAVCHLLGMSSACANPWLYGWYNDNFRSEFRDIVGPLMRCCGRYCPAMARQLSVMSSSSSRQKGARRQNEGSSCLNGADAGDGDDDDRLQIRLNDDDSPSRLTNNIPMTLTSTQANATTCEVEVTVVDSSYFQQQHFQSSPML